MQAAIVTLTINPALDKHTEARRVVPNRKLRCNIPVRTPGGGGINVSRAIRRLGGESLAIYPRGGPLGRMLERLVADENIAQRTIPIEGGTRENLMVFEEENSDQQYRFIMPGPELREGEWQQVLNVLAAVEPAPDYVVASGSIPPGVPETFYQRVAEIARSRHCRLIVDTSQEPLRMAAEAGVYLLKPNMRELSHLAGRAIESEEEQVDAATELVQSRRAEVVVVSLGAGGALFVTSDRTERLRAPTVPIRSRIGAGDSMVAGMVLGLAKGRDVRDAALFGIAAGAATVMLPGTELCRKEDTERLYERLGSE